MNPLIGTWWANLFVGIFVEVDNFAKEEGVPAAADQEINKVVDSEV